MYSWSLVFFLNSILFGVGLAMDAFSVSAANGLHEPRMPRSRMCLIAGTFCAFQIVMPLIGWICVHTVLEFFSAFSKAIPWIALLLLLYIGGKMLLEGIRFKEGESESKPLSARLLIVQGIATSIDALSVGFTIADLPFWQAFAESLIIGAVTFFICIGGLLLGRKLGTRLSGKASILGGVILIAIGLEIFISSFIG